MSYRLIFGLLGALMLTLPAFASEDMSGMMFGDDTSSLDENAFAQDLDVLSDSALAELATPESEVSRTPQIDGMPKVQSAPMQADIQEIVPIDLPPQEDFEVPFAEASTPVPAEAAPIPSTAKGDDLTDTLKKDAAASQPGLPLPKVEGTWVNKLASSNPLDIISADKTKAATLEAMVQNSRGDKANAKSNASVFDISGVMLRMSLPQVDEIMQNRGFRKMMQKYQVPNFIKWRNEEYCRTNGVAGYERTEACVIEKAKKDKHQYVQTTKYAKFDTKEEVEVTFTSNFTDNKVYKIAYTSTSSGITGNSPKAIYLRNIKIYDFWKKINQKYGKPDDKDAVTWGMGDNKPYLKAKTGYLLLEDPMLRELDYTRMSREDQRYLNTDLYSF